MSYFDKKITIIVPIYNMEVYISECIESILNQTYFNLQILLIDDGSTDRSGIICDYYAKQDKRVEVIHTKNGGLVAARKMGLLHSTGQYIGFVDADDYIEKEMYETLLKDICESDADFVHMGYIAEQENLSEEILGFESGDFYLERFEDRELFLVKFLLQANAKNFIVPSIWAKLFKADLIKKSYFLIPDEWQYGEDLLNLCLCILQSERILLDRKALYHYRVRKGSMSHLSDTEYFMKEMQLLCNVENVIKSYSIQAHTDLKENIYFFSKTKVLNLMRMMSEKEIIIPNFYLKEVESLRGKRVVLYGAGNVGQDYYTQLSRYEDIEIVAWLDSNWTGCQYDYARVSNIDVLKNCDYDKILIAVQEKKVAKEIEDMLLNYGEKKHKIVWLKPGRIFESGLAGQ